MPEIASREAWLVARKQLLAQEKAHDRARDGISAARRALPMVEITEPYVFDAPRGDATLLDLFAGRAQLIVYHFMFAPDWQQGCKSCSFLADTFDGASKHLPARDTSFAAVSRAPLAKLEAFKARMGWSFTWVSSERSSFNYDFHVSFREGERETAEYNYRPGGFPQPEAPGASVFLREGDRVFHTYSTYGRGLDHLIGTYNYLDLTARGRAEDGLKSSMSWLRHHDRYER